MKKISLLLVFSIATINIFAQVDSLFSLEIASHRVAYKKDFLADTRSPLQAEDLPHLRFYEPDARYRFICDFIRTPDEKPFDLPTYSGVTRLYVKYGTVHFEWEGKKQQLAVYQNLTMRNVPGYADYLFLPFKDLSSGEATYGGGRYIDFKVSDIKDDKVVVDFNRCYNPWCAYSDGYSCPIPPTENHLEMAVEAGELMFAGEKKH